ncbi:MULTISPECIES: type VI secretion protein IcmF/TssM N-terminal domain-containing protein [unclassified Variovorax]|uniref:type VI secretion protein IcmF/TssM N-terminal domain-containing protein n=1 Tax=unclassified Variovorax TaxID=663243 RepID=UPI003ED16281
MNALHPLPTYYWPLLALCLLGLLALWWFMLGSRYFARRRMLRRRIAVLGPPSNPSEQAALAALRQAIAQARELLLRSPAQRAVRNPLYDQPWFLFIGDESAGLPGLLAAARRASPPPLQTGPDTAGDVFWRWHFLRSMIAIETSPAAVREPASRHERGLWYHALLALAHQRERQPLNGIVVCVSAAGLLGDTKALASDATRLRQRVDEAAEHLRLHLPVYLVVTGLERLAGYGVLRSALPPEALVQALGYRLPDNATAGARPDDPFGPMADRLHALRMGLLRSQPEPARRLAIHSFVEQLRAFQPGLRTLVERMFDNGLGRTLAPAHWRGLYVVAAPADGEDDAFVADLFQRFLPADQPLARG